jgi:hypothetical protein
MAVRRKGKGRHMLGLTDKQKMILDFLVGYTVTNLSFPTIRRVARHIKIKSSTGVLNYYCALAKRGF